MSFKLVMKSAPYPDKEFPLVKDEMVIGRDTASDIVISDAEISRRHARIYKLGDSYMIEDLGSTNGTWIDGEKINGPTVLMAGAKLQIGRTSLELSS